ncbi:hypothetical protein V1264_003402 [Littorina saxatilis]|uniref:Protein kinase domain-containing protein n=3 Tax=Littorina saxatilis TaxID=31220 RepID=A0AAN9B5S9_9CAEN
MLHSKGVIHRDLNLDNILICENGHVVLSNFGYSLQLDLDEIDSATYNPWPDANVKPFLPAPELQLGLVYDKTVDWWSLGVIVYRMVCGEFPFSASQRKVGLGASSQIELVYRREPYPQYLSMPAKQMISQLLARKRLRRLGSGKYEESAISGAPFFYHVDWAQIRDYTFPAPFSELVHPAYHREGNRKAAMHLPVSYMGPMTNTKLTESAGGEAEGLSISASRHCFGHDAISSGTVIVQKKPFLLRAKSWFGRCITGEGAVHT